MPLKKQERKDEYVKVMSLMIESKHKEAFDALRSMCGTDTGLFWLVDYDIAVNQVQKKRINSLP